MRPFCEMASFQRAVCFFWGVIYLFLFFGKDFSFLVGHAKYSRCFFKVFQTTRS